jgi:hypothetical protein
MLKAALITALVAALFALLGCGSEVSDDAASLSPPSATTTSPPPPAASEHFTRANWVVLATEPASHIGATVDIVGRVWSTVTRDHEGMLGFAMDVEPKSSKWEAQVAFPDSSRQGDFDQDDYVRVQGTVRTTWTSDAHDVYREIPEILASSVSRVERPQ